MVCLTGMEYKMVAIAGVMVEYVILCCWVWLLHVWLPELSLSPRRGNPIMVNMRGMPEKC